MQQECLLCREVRGDVDLPGGLHEAANHVAFHLPEQQSGDVLLGHHLVVPRRHVPDYGGLDADEAADVGRTVAELSRALSGEGAERVYVFSVGHSWPHLHIHVVPRWPGVPDSVEWWRVKDEPGDQRVRADTAASFAERIRLKIS